MRFAPPDGAGGGHSVGGLRCADMAARRRGACERLAALFNATFAPGAPSARDAPPGGAYATWGDVAGALEALRGAGDCVETNHWFGWS